MSKENKTAKKATKADTKPEPAKLKKIKTGLKGGRSVDPCNNVVAQ